MPITLLWNKLNVCGIKFQTKPTDILSVNEKSPILGYKERGGGGPIGVELVTLCNWNNFQVPKIS